MFFLYYYAIIFIIISIIIYSYSPASVVLFFIYIFFSSFAFLLFFFWFLPPHIPSPPLPGTPYYHYYLFLFLLLFLFLFLLCLSALPPFLLCPPAFTSRPACRSVWLVWARFLPKPEHDSKICLVCGANRAGSGRVRVDRSCLAGAVGQVASVRVPLCLRKFLTAGAKCSVKFVYKAPKHWPGLKYCRSKWLKVRLELVRVRLPSLMDVLGRKQIKSELKEGNSAVPPPWSPFFFMWISVSEINKFHLIRI